MKHVRNSIRARLVFVKEYLRTGRAVDAYLAAAPSTAGPGTIRVEAFRFLRAPKTRQLLDLVRKKAASRVSISIADTIAKDAQILRFDPARIFDNDGNLLPFEDMEPDDRQCISALEVTETTDMEGKVTRKTKVKIRDVGPAVDRLNRVLGAYARDNAQKQQVGVRFTDDLVLANHILHLITKPLVRTSAGRLPQTITQST